MATDKPGTRQDTEGELGVVERPRIQQPRKYVVVLHNDDYTTMEFVVHVLQKFFHLDETEATQVMLHVHHKGFGIVGTFTRDVAETKVKATEQLAEQHEYPLLVTIEPAAGEPRE